MSAKVIKREFLFKEGLGSFETIIDSPIGKFDTIEATKQYVADGQYTIGAFMVLLNENNKLVLAVQGEEDIAALQALSEALAEFVVELEAVFALLEEAEDGESNVLAFKGTETPTTEEVETE